MVSRLASGFESLWRPQARNRRLVATPVPTHALRRHLARREFAASTRIAIHPSVLAGGEAKHAGRCTSSQSELKISRRQSRSEPLQVE